MCSSCSIQQKKTSVFSQVHASLREEPLHFTLLDPDKQKPVKAGKLSRIAMEAGTDAIMVGGSTIPSQQLVDETVKEIKKNTDLPVILFPSGANLLSKYADALFFMSLLNSRNPDFIIREHVKGSFFVKQSGLEPISMGYVIVEPGMTAGRLGEADLVKQDDVQTAVGYALAAQYLGMKFFYLEAGSGADRSIPSEMITAVKNSLDIPLIIGGGIRDPQTAQKKARAGADIIVTGTIFEKEESKKKLENIINAIK